MGKRNGGAVAKLTDKLKHRAMRAHLGTHKSILTRVGTKATHHEKALAFLQHQRAIHGLVVNGVQVLEGGRNPGPVFEGTGVPDELPKRIKTTAERAADDKRRPLKDEMVEGWKPARYEPKFMRFVRR